MGNPSNPKFFNTMFTSSMKVLVLGAALLSCAHAASDDSYSLKNLHRYIAEGNFAGVEEEINASGSAMRQLAPNNLLLSNARLADYLNQECALHHLELEKPLTAVQRLNHLYGVSADLSSHKVDDAIKIYHLLERNGAKMDKALLDVLLQGLAVPLGTPTPLPAGFVPDKPTLTKLPIPVPDPTPK